MDLDFIKNSYSRFNDDELKKLSNELETLQPEVVEVLRDELIKRGLKNEQIKVETFLTNGSKKLKYLSKDKLKDVIQDRIKNGETLENIRLDFKQNDIDIFEYVELEKNRVVKENNIKQIENIVFKKEDRHSALKALQDEFNVDNNEAEKLLKKISSAGKENIIFGGLITLFAFGVFFNFFHIYLPILLRVIVSIFIGYIGFKKIYRGIKQSNF